jgi:hypothetical protein
MMLLIRLLVRTLLDTGQLFDRVLGHVQDGDTSYDGHGAARHFHFSGSESEAGARVDAHCPQSASLVEISP